jgi:hypothetical protein
MSSEVRIRDAVDLMCQRGASPEYKSTLQQQIIGANSLGLSMLKLGVGSTQHQAYAVGIPIQLGRNAPILQGLARR